MYSLIIYEMARTVNALKFQLTLFSLDEYGLLKEGVHLFFFFFFLFALLIRFLTFLSACCFLSESVIEARSTVTTSECKNRENEAS